MDDLLRWVLDHAWAAIAAGFAYFYKRNEKARDDAMVAVNKRLDQHADVISDKLVKKDDFNDLKNFIRDELRYVRERVDEIADRKSL